MPKYLKNRCREDCIEEFLASAAKRFADGKRLMAGGRRTAAIYLWGYTVEMILKAAVFKALGYMKSDRISPADLRFVKGKASTYRFIWQGNFHNLEYWARAFVAEKKLTGSMADLIVAKARQVYRYWSETLRYHKNEAYSFEVSKVHSLAEWFLEYFSSI